MNWGVHLLANLAIALVVAAWRVRGRPAWEDVAPLFWPQAASNLIDLDHLLADPVYDPDRCSLGFHPLHGRVATVAYLLGTLWPRVRWFAIGALTHLALDGVDCFV